MIQRIGPACTALVVSALYPFLVGAMPAESPEGIRHVRPNGSVERRVEVGELSSRESHHREPTRATDDRPVPSRHLPVDRTHATEDAAPRDLQARHLFQIAERCRNVGDTDKARTCYEEAHLISPTSRCGRLAIERLRDLDRGRFGNNDVDAAEEQEATPVRPWFRELPDRRPGLRYWQLPPRRDPHRRTDDDRRHLEMLQGTKPLDTLPQGIRIHVRDTE